MDTQEAILNRRSTRKFKNEFIPRDEINKIVELALKAPSGKNNEPWRLFALEGDKKKEFEAVMEKGINDVVSIGVPPGSSKHTLEAIKKASTVILVYNKNSKRDQSYRGSEKIKWSVDTQSIGGMIQTMLLAAEDMGYGSLWICDTFYADHHIGKWLHTDREMVAAVAIGIKDEFPSARPRKPINELMQWL